LTFADSRDPDLRLSDVKKYFGIDFKTNSFEEMSNYIESDELCAFVQNDCQI
jgi:hypothetical protein